MAVRSVRDTYMASLDPTGHDLGGGATPSPFRSGPVTARRVQRPGPKLWANYPAAERVRVHARVLAVLSAR